MVIPFILTSPRVKFWFEIGLTDTGRTARSGSVAQGLFAGVGASSGVSVDAAIAAVAANLATVKSHQRNSRARTLLSGLTADGYLADGLEDDEGWVWLPV